LWKEYHSIFVLRLFCVWINFVVDICSHKWDRTKMKLNCAILITKFIYGSTLTIFNSTLNWFINKITHNHCITYQNNATSNKQFKTEIQTCLCLLANLFKTRLIDRSIRLGLGCFFLFQILYQSFVEISLLLSLFKQVSYSFV